MRPFFTLLIAAAGIYLALAVLLYLFQNRMVFLANMPGRALDMTPADAGFSYEDVHLVTDDGVRLHGWFVPAERSRGVLLFLHGNAGNISHRLDSIAIFRDLGMDVLIIDYRGYGRSEGRPSEQGTYLDARAAWDHLVDERGIEPGRIAVFGRSLGAAVVSHLAIDTTPAGVILESCFSSALDMARRLYPFMPARLITRLDYPATDNARRFNSPVMVIHSRHDEIIPFEMGRAVYDAAPQPKRFLEIHGDHNAGFFLSRAIYVPGLAGFLDEHLGPMPAGMADPESG